MKLSIIIPLAVGEAEPEFLLDSLAALADIGEVIIVGSDCYSPPTAGRSGCCIQRISSDDGRANALNAGAAAACGQWLWFLHADSRLDDSAVRCLRATLDGAGGLYYFGLHFHSDNTKLAARMRLNSLGVTLRSRYLLSPFGDQGLCIDRNSFNRAGVFPPRRRYGEDHVFVWQCRLAGIAVTALPASISTDARKYQHHGWLSTTVRHNLLWIKQWGPLFCRWLWLKTISSRAAVDKTP